MDDVRLINAPIPVHWEGPGWPHAGWVGGGDAMGWEGTIIGVALR